MPSISPTPAFTDVVTPATGVPDASAGRLVAAKLAGALVIRSRTRVRNHVRSASSPQRARSTATPASTVTLRSGRSVGLPIVKRATPPVTLCASPARPNALGATNARPALACTRAPPPSPTCTPPLGLNTANVSDPACTSGRKGVASRSSVMRSTRPPAVATTRPSSASTRPSAKPASEPTAELGLKVPISPTAPAVRAKRCVRARASVTSAPTVSVCAPQRITSCSCAPVVVVREPKFTNPVSAGTL
jgi:hypothetical protein